MVSVHSVSYAFNYLVSTVIALCTFEELIDAYRAKRKLKYDNSKREGKQSMSPYWPPVGQEENFGPFKVQTVRSEHLDEKRVMEWFDLEYRDTKDIDQHSIRLFLCKDWPTLMETNHTTGRHDRYVNRINYRRFSLDEHQGTVVACTSYPKFVLTGVSVTK